MHYLDALTIKARMILAFVMLVGLVVAFGAFATMQMERLGELTETLYDHPLQVSNASLRASMGVVKMHRSMKDVPLANTELDLHNAIDAVRDDEKIVYADLDVVRQQILGEEGQRLESETRDLFARWKPIRDEVIGLQMAGDKVAAALITKGKGADHVALLGRKMMELTSYAHAKAGGFMDQARRTQTRVRQTTLGLVGVVAVLAGVLLYVVSRSVLASVESLKGTMEEISQSGKLVKSELRGNSELAEMAGHFNRLIELLDGQLWLREGLNRLNSEMAGLLAYDDLAQAGTRFICRHVDACAGALYEYDGESGQCVLRASYAIVERKHFADRFARGEGIVGQVAVERKPILLTNLSSEDAVSQSGTTTEPPRNIYVLPLTHEHRLHGVLEVAMFEAFGERQRQFLDAAGAVVATALYAAAQGQRVKTLLDDAHARNLELNAKTDQLNAANDQLSAVNEELQSQAEELRAQAEQLKAQTAELEAQRSRVEESDRLKSEFLSNMSHELRTPLNSVMALSQLMISRGVGADPGQETEYLRIIERNGRQLLSLINDILDLSKIESGRMDVYVSEFCSRELVESAVETVRPLAEAKGLPIRLLADQSVRIHNDQEKVRQILVNLLSNAVKFTDSGAIDVTVAGDDARARFSVRDTGIGIPDSALQHVFDEFRQVDGSTTRRHEGTGLGLSICRKLAWLMGGEISVVSTPGVGSTFTLSLPLAAPASAKVEPRPTTPTRIPPRVRAAQHTQGVAGATDADRGTVLVIDDEESARTVLREHLVSSGHRVAEAGSGSEGLQLARQLRPFAITLDVMMPQMDGWEVITRLKESPETEEIPVIMVSISEDRAAGIALGAAGYVVKPVKREVLLAELERLAWTRKIRRVLVVDDDPAVREQLTATLGDRGYRVETAPGGAEGLALAGGHPPDAIVLDLMMPEVDGFTFLARLREAPETADIPVIVLTAKDLTAEDRARLEAATNQIIGKVATSTEVMLQNVDASLQNILQQRCHSGVADKPRVLVVEDNAVAALQIRTALEESGYQVDTAPGGKEALVCVRAAVPDAMVLDLMMPGVDGFQVLEQVRASSSSAALPVLVLTAKELTAEDRTRLAHGQTQELVQKGSLDRRQLVARVDRLMGENPVPAPASTPGSRPGATPVSGWARPGRGDTVLVVEDNADNRFTIAALLDELGCKHQAVEDGEQAVRAAGEIRPGLILMDVQLPVLSGLDATRRIKADPLLREIPVVALTAKAMKGHREEILAAGCDGYLPKPVDPVAFAETVRKWMG